MRVRDVAITATVGLFLTLTTTGTASAADGTAAETGQSPASTPAPTATPPEDADAQLLDGPARGQRALDELGAEVSVAARLNDLSSSQLRTLLTTDRTAWLDGAGRIYYVDPAPTELPSVVAPEAAAPYPLDQTFTLHSKPGSTKTIYLDFDGQDVTGTAWNADPSVGGTLLPAGFYEGWTIDGDASTFSDTERTSIQNIWQRVSEDYAPFDVDVTTADPGEAALNRSNSADPTYGTRALISPSEAARSNVCGGTCGGVAYRGVFDLAGYPVNYVQPAWVFPQVLGPNDAKSIAEAISHEVGHNLGLQHDGTAAQGYYAGQGSWAPIMGVGYYKPISQFSKGEYAGANNTEDDFAVIASHGLSLRADEAGATTATAAPVTTTVSGFITSAGDVDVFTYHLGCDGVMAHATPAVTSPNLDLGLKLLAADGSTISAANPLSGGTGDVATGMGAQVVDQAATAGTYFLQVDGVGALDPSTTGYSDYGSVGAYTLTLDWICPPVAPWAPQGLGISKNDADTSVTLSWTPPEYDGASPVTGYRVKANGGTPVSLPASARSWTANGFAPGQDVTLAVAAVNGVGTGAYDSRSITMAESATVPTAPQGIVLTADDSAATVTLAWTAPSSNGGSAILGYSLYRDDTLVETVGATRNSYTFDGLTYAQDYAFSVRAENVVGSSAAAGGTTHVAQAPGSPTTVTVTTDNVAQTAVLSWAAPASNGGASVTGYRLTRAGAQVASVGAGTSTYTFHDLARGQSTELGVIAVNRVGPGAPASTTATLAAIPTAPTALMVSRGNAKVTISWAPPGNAATSEVTGYQIRRITAGGDPSDPVVLPSTTRSYVWTGLSNGTSYAFSVTAVSGLVAGPPSLSTSVVPATKPGAAKIGRAASGTAGGAITAKALWSAPASTGGSAVTGYVVTAYRMSAAGAVLQKVVSASRPGTATSYAMTLPRSGSWRFSVHAVNAVGAGAESARSNLVTAR